MGLNIEMARKAEGRAQQLAKNTGLPAELFLDQAYKEILAEVRESAHNEEDEDDAPEPA